MSLETLENSPYGSLFLLEEEEREKMLQIFFKLPANLKQMITSQKTAAYLEGVVRSFDAQEKDTPLLAMSVLQVALGLKSLAQLPAIISTNVKLPNDRSQKMAAEIEKDLFAPIILEYNQFIASQKSSTPFLDNTSPATFGARNVLDLKSQPPKQPTPPPPMPPGRFTSTRP